MGKLTELGFSWHLAERAARGAGADAGLAAQLLLDGTVPVFCCYRLRDEAAECMCNVALSHGMQWLEQSSARRARMQHGISDLKSADAGAKAYVDIALRWCLQWMEVWAR